MGPKMPSGLDTVTAGTVRYIGGDLVYTRGSGEDTPAKVLEAVQNLLKDDDENKIIYADIPGLGECEISKSTTLEDITKESILKKRKSAIGRDMDSIVMRISLGDDPRLKQIEDFLESLRT